MSQLKKGALLTYVNVLLTNVIGLVLTPFIIRELGDSEYGLYVLIGSFVGYLSLMNLGVNNAIIRFIAKYKAKNDKKGELEFLGTTIWVYMFISFILVVMGLILYFNLESIFGESLNPNEMRKAKIMFLILVGNLAITVPGGSFEAICNGYEHFVFPRTLKIVRYVIRAFTIYCVLTLGGKAISIVIVDTIFGMSIILITAVYVFSKLKIKISLKVFNKGLVKEILGYSLWVFLFGIVYKFQWNAGQIVLGINTDTVTVAVYGVGVLLGGYYGAFAGGINSVLVPRATQMVVTESSGKELTDVMIKIGRLNTFMLLLVSSGFILFGKTFIILWVGKTYELSWSIALLIMGVMTLPLIQAFGNSVLEAKKKNRFKSLLSFFTVGLGVIVGYFLSKEYGAYGIAIPLITAMAVNSLVMNFYYKKIFDFKIIYFFKKTLIIPLMVHGLLTTTALYVLKEVQIDSWFYFMIYAIIYASIYIIITYFLLMNSYEKSLIKKGFR